MSILYSPDFGANLEGWLFKNLQRYADWLYKNRQKIPAMFRKPPTKLYRGMVVEQSFFDELDKTGTIRLKAHTSWSKDIKLATKFALSPEFQIKGKDGIPILITKTVTPTSTILDIESVVQFLGNTVLSEIGVDESSIDSAIKEREVLIAKGAQIKRHNLEILS